MSDTIVSDTGAEPPFRAEHVGSLLRPAALLAARAEYEGGRITAGMLRETEDDYIRRVVVMQAELGLKGVTDGEFRRGSWHMDFLYQIGGVEKTDRTLHLAFKNKVGTVEFSPAAHRVAGKLRLDRTIFAEDFAFLKSVAPPGTTPKLTIPSPSMLHYRGGRAAIDPATYPELEAFRHDLASVYKQERLLSASGVMEACGGGFRYDDGFRRSAVAGEHGVLSSWPQWTRSTSHPCSTTRSASPWCASTAGQRASVALDAAATRWSGTGMTTRSHIGSGIAARRARRALTTSAGQCWPGTTSRCGSGCCASTSWV